MSKENLRKLKRTVYLMLIIAILTFFSGFLKYTPFEHISLLLFSLLALGGLKLFYGAINVKLNGISKLFLIFTSMSTIAFMLLVTIASLKTLIYGLTLSDNLELLEGAFYLTSAIFLVGVIGCIIFLNIKGDHNAKKP